MATSYTYASPEQMLRIQQMLGNPTHMALTAVMVAQETGLSNDSAVAALRRAEADGVAVELEQAGWYTATPAFGGQPPVKRHPASQRPQPTATSASDDEQGLTLAARIAGQMAAVAAWASTRSPRRKLGAPFVGNHPGPFINFIVMIWMVAVLLVVVLPAVLKILFLLLAELLLAIAWIVVVPFSAVAVLRR